MKLTEKEARETILDDLSTFSTDSARLGACVEWLAREQVRNAELLADNRALRGIPDPSSVETASEAARRADDYAKAVAFADAKAIAATEPDFQPGKLPVTNDDF